MRGSGCSGGAFDLFGLPTTYDGYDAVETVARAELGQGRQGRHGRHLVLRHHAAVHGRHAAAAPGGDRADVGHRRHLHGTGYPGGIFNSGLRADVDQGAHGRRQARARGRPAVGEGARQGRATSTASPTRSCACRPRTRSKLQDQNPFRTPSLFAHALARRVAEARDGADVPRRPVPGRADRRPLRRGLRYLASNPNVWLSLQNGVHADSLGPSDDHALGRVPEALRGERDPERPGHRDRPQRRALRVPRRRGGGAGGAVALRRARPTSPRPRRPSSRTRASGC